MDAMAGIKSILGDKPLYEGLDLNETVAEAKQTLLENVRGLKLTLDALYKQKASCKQQSIKLALKQQELKNRIAAVREKIEQSTDGDRKELVKEERQLLHELRAVTKNLNISDGKQEEIMSEVGRKKHEKDVIKATMNSNESLQVFVQHNGYGARLN